MAASIENVLSSLIPLYFDDSSSPSQVPDILQYTDDHQLFSLQKTSSLHPVISHIHNCLNSSNKRLEGLLLLEKLVEQSSTLVFTDNIHTWIKLLLQILKSPGETTFHQYACKIISNIIRISTSFSEISREIATNIISQLLPVLLHSQPVYREEALSCIKVCAECYPGPTGSFRSKIEKLLLTDLQSSTPKSSSPSCLAILGACGPGGKNRIKHTEGWTTQFKKIYSTLQNTISLLYESLDNEDKVREISEGFQLNVLPDTLPTRHNVLLHRLSVFTQVLSALLTEKLTAVAKIPIEDILRFIYRCLDVKGNVLLKKPTTDNILLLAILPTIHKISFTLLYNLIISCGGVLVPFTSTINKLLIQSLVWTDSKTQYGQQKQYSLLRQEVYKTMSIWLETLGSTCNIIEEEEDIVKQIIHDITPPTDVIKFSTNGNHDGQEPPKKKKKYLGYQELTQGMVSFRKIDLTANSALVETCLKAFELFIFHFGTSLKSKTYTDIQETVTSIILDIQGYNDKLPIPYDDDRCRKRLYAVLRSCVMSPHAKLPTLLQCAIRIFNIGQRDRSLKVSSFCRECSAVCECIYHPRVPCIRGPNLSSLTLHLNKHQSSDQQQTNTDSRSEPVTQNIQAKSVKRLSLSRSKIENTNVLPVPVIEVQTNSSPVEVAESSESETEEIEDQVMSGTDTVLETSVIETVQTVITKGVTAIETEGVMPIADLEEGSHDNIGDTEQNKEVDDMVMCFVDADPDEPE